MMNFTDNIVSDKRHIETSYLKFKVIDQAQSRMSENARY